MKYSIKDLAEGRCACINDSEDVEHIFRVMKTAFPNDTDCQYDEDNKQGMSQANDLQFYAVENGVTDNWFPYDETELPKQSVIEFYEQLNLTPLNEEFKLIRRFKTGAVRGSNVGRVRPDWISPYAIEEISKVLIENANDFGACNYFLGIDEEACLESMARHLEELKEAILIKKDMTEAKIIARSVGFNAVAMLHTMVLKEKGLYKEHFYKTELVTLEEAKKSNQFITN